MLNEIGSGDHSVNNEYRIFGPPGTGKTSRVSQEIERAIDRFGSRSIIAASFSRAAATELVGRDLPLEEGQIGTLHSFCWRALGKPRIAEANVGDWNRRFSPLQLTPARQYDRLDGEDIEEEAVAPGQDGNYALQQLNRCRNLLLPQEQWPVEVHDFARKWADYKSANRLMDFTDLIDVAAQNIRVAMARPQAIFIDEAQDLTPLQLQVVRQWGRHADYFVLAGDDDQMIYGWCGASTAALLGPVIPEAHKVFLRKSHRVPRAVHALAGRLVRQISMRQQKVYEPRDSDGAVVRLSQTTYKSAEYFMLKSIETHLADGKRVMILASCAYMLRPFIAVLRKNGIPYCNPYRKTYDYWNPLRGGKNSSLHRVLALIAPSQRQHDRWSAGELCLWMEWLRPGLLRDKACEILQGEKTDAPIPMEQLAEFFERQALQSLHAALRHGHCALLEWWRSRIQVEFWARTKFVTQVISTSGLLAVSEEPRCVLGTIHSVKGGQADVVYLFPDLSRAADMHYQRLGESRDSVLRTFYVGLTRCRETLYICGRHSVTAITI